ncbi:MAG TPA: DUF2062 domain-containing protein [Paucimonas sp.]|nr:DUF2062 domain-containing protein [Paucimonas sp.]
MRIPRYSRYFPTAQELKDNRFLRPFVRHLHHHSFRQFNRRPVAGGVAIGLFFGILVPFLQIFLAASATVVLRVNLPVAVGLIVFAVAAALLGYLAVNMAWKLKICRHWRRLRQTNVFVL